MEEWRPIVGYEGIYEISSNGNVKSIRRREYSKKRGFYVLKEKILTPVKINHGYLSIILTKDGKHKHHYVHRLVACAFIPNPRNLPQINHKNEIKTDNSIHNLEWCTNDYNRHYGTVQERMSRSCRKRVAQYTKDGVLVACYKSLADAAKINGFKVPPISNCFVGRTKTSYGYIWKPINNL